MFPSDEQRLILNSEHRITVVHAVPGSGKTSVFVELFLSKASSLVGSKQKIAALSFTTSASNEIESRSSSAISEHFVGTIDSFLVKYVLKPFGVLFGLPSSGISIIPSPLDEEMQARTVRVGRTAQDDISIFKLKFSGGTVANPVFTYTKNFRQETVLPEYTAAVLQAKQREWQARGRFTHSDCQYFAAKILSDEEKAPIILGILGTKFPWVLLDEFQDTGNFLYIAVKKIFSHPTIKGLVVGDPDQAIFEFSGANPNNFTDLLEVDGAEALPMTTTRRCPQNLCNFARTFTNPGTTITAANPDVIGNIRIVSYNQELVLTEQLITTLVDQIGDLDETLVVSRKSKDVRRLSGEVANQDYKIKSIAPRSIHNAIILFRRGKSNEAFKIISRTVSNLIWNEEVVAPSDRPALNWIDWKRKIYSLMINLESTLQGESWNQWVLRARNLVRDIAATYNVTNTFSPSFKNDNANGNELRVITQVVAPLATTIQSFKFKNIHEAKGTESHTVIWYIPKQRVTDCVFNECFGPTPNYEEMRVAFVAITRSKKNLVILMHQSALARLQNLRPGLNTAYEVINN